MKNKTFRFLLLSLLAVLLLCCSCTNRQEEDYGIFEQKDGTLLLQIPGDTDGSIEEIPVIRYSAADFNDYQIIRGETAAAGEVTAAQLVREAFRPAVQLSLSTDWVKRGESAPTGTKEILVGVTNRPETLSSYGTMRRDDYSICYENDRIVICGGSPAASVRAAEVFSRYFIDADTASFVLPASGEYRYNAQYLCDTYLLNGVSIRDYTVSGNRETNSAVSFLKTYIADMTGYTALGDGSGTCEIRLLTGETEGICSVSVTGNRITVTSKQENSMLAVRYFLSQLEKDGGINMNERSRNYRTEVGNSTLTNDMLLAAEPSVIYLSPDGSDETGNGSIEAPLASLKAAKEQMGKLTRTSVGNVVLCLRGGDYVMTEGVTFDGGDSGRDGAPFTICAYEGEQVRLIGGIWVDPALVRTAENQEIISRVIDKRAAEKLYQIDLSSLVEKIPDYYCFGHEESDAKLPMEIYVNGKALDRSRYPNNIPGEGYLRTTAKVKDNIDGSKTIVLDTDAAKRMKLWSENAADDLYLFGFLAWDWTNEVYDAKLLDRANAAVTLLGGTNSYFSSITGDKRYYFFNLPEEIDVPGESYIDRKARIVYYYPHQDSANADIYVSTLTEPMLTFSDTEHVIIENIAFSYTRGNAVTAKNVSDFTMKNCEITHTSSNAATFTGKKITVTGCQVYDTASGGFFFRGGSRAELVPSETRIENCVIHAVNRDQKTYQPGIEASAMGMVIANNQLYDCVHQMIAVHSNDIVIEYNEIFDCVKEAADMGAIYFGRDPSLMGTVIRYNYFHDIGNRYGGIGQQSIFIDDGNNGAVIFGNIFLRGTYDTGAVKTHGAQFSEMKNNIFIEMPAAYQNADWRGLAPDGIAQLRWIQWIYDRGESDQHNIVAKISENKFDSDLWREHYAGTIWAQVYDYIDSEHIKERCELSKAEFDTWALEHAPRNTNILSGNVFIDIDKLYTGGSCVCDENLVLETGKGLFRSFGQDFTLTEEGLAVIRASIPTFEEIPFDRIGPLK